jgi:hypothetical protein
MRLIDLEYIFKAQLEDFQDKPGMIYYMLIEDGINHLQRTISTNLEELLVTLDNFEFRGYTEKMPRFMK